MDSVTRTARVYIVLVIVAIAPFGLLLDLYPSGAPGYWAWTVSEPRTAMLIGSIYFVSTIYYVILFRQRDWLRIEMSLRSLFIFAGWLLVAAMFHWDTFFPYRATTLAWLVASYLPLFFVPILFRLQAERSGVDDDAGGVRIARGWQVWLRARGVVYLIGALALFAMAPVVASSWPWPLEPVNARMLSGQVALFGGFQGFAMREGSWRRMQLFMLITGMMGVAHLVALTLPLGGYDWAKPLAMPVMLMPLEWVGTSVGMFLAHRAR